MPSVTELGYLGLSVTNLAAWRTYAAEVAGMEVVDDGEGDRIYLRMDAWHHRIVLHAGEVDDLAYLGWRVGDPVEFEAMVGKLSAAGIAVTVASDAEARERRVLARPFGDHIKRMINAEDAERADAHHGAIGLAARVALAAQGFADGVAAVERL